MQTSSETYFFRDNGQFDLLRNALLPELIERRSQNKTLLLWSAGCASGEEPYSLAILVDMLLPEKDNWLVLITGSDINKAALAKAKQGRYKKWSFRETPTEIQKRYFCRIDDEWILDERIRSMVSFHSMDIISEPFPNKDLHDIDLILCRNVFIYFDLATVALVANKLAATLNEGGYLMTAHTELNGVPMPDLQSKLFKTGMVYQRLNKTPVTTLPKAVAPPRLPTPDIKQWTLSAPDDTSQNPSEPTALLTTARHLADRGEYDEAMKMCLQALSSEPLMAAPHFLLAQIAQLRGDFEGATKLLENTLYLDPSHTSALLELAALYERAQNQPRALSLRRTALSILRKLPNETLIEPYGATAGEITQWLTQCTNV